MNSKAKKKTMDAIVKAYLETLIEFSKNTKISESELLLLFEEKSS